MRGILPILLALPAVIALARPAPCRGDRLLRGADVSFLPQVEAGGGVFRDEGAPADLFAILRAHGIDTIRLRLWHTPADGHGGLAETLALAERARAAGCNVLLDLHYSDTWADPGRQDPPAAWVGLTLPVLADSVRAYTRDVMAAFAARSGVPRIVQLGNEITAGLLWDEGRVDGAHDTPAQWDDLVRLLEAAEAGIADVVPSLGAAQPPAIMLHLDRGADNRGARRFLDHVIGRGIRFELIGLSYYPWWHGSLEALAANLDDLARRYRKGLVVVETAYPWTLGWFDGTHNQVGLPGQLLAGFPATPEGQLAFARAVLDVVRAVPEGAGRGVFLWEPEWIATPGFGSAWENLAAFDQDGAALPVLRAFEAPAAPPAPTGPGR